MGRVSVSVVIPTHGRPEALAACLEGLASQTCPRDLFEAVVVDNRNPPGLIESVAADYTARLRLRVVSEPIPGPAAARNTGARAATSTLLAFIDDDCVPEPGWIAALAAAHGQGPEALIGGTTIDGEPRGLCTSASRLVLDYFCARANADPRDPRFFPSNNLAAPAVPFHAAGGFDTRFARAAGEDRDFCDRWRARGGQLRHAPEAVVRHVHPLTIRTFVRQQMSYGRGAFRFHSAHAGRGLAPLPFYAGLLAYPFRHARAVRAAALAGLVVVSQAAVAAGYFWEMAFGGLKGLRSGD